MAAKLKKGDTVIVLTGKDKGKKGEISSVSPAANKAVVDGLNIAIRHTKAAACRKRCRLICRTCPFWTKTAKQPALGSAWTVMSKCALPKQQGMRSDA
jgi:ribosomal protein L24